MILWITQMLLYLERRVDTILLCMSMRSAGVQRGLDLILHPRGLESTQLRIVLRLAHLLLEIGMIVMKWIYVTIE